MCSFLFPARVRITGESFVEKWVGLAVDRVVYEPIAHARFVNIARLGVTDFEMVIPAVLIRSSDEFTM
jgi:hypothetical protein